MTIREELRACAATRRVAVRALPNITYSIIYCFCDPDKGAYLLDDADRATFVLLVAEAL